jgi:hypothetical protein
MHGRLVVDWTYSLKLILQINPYGFIDLAGRHARRHPEPSQRAVQRGDGHPIFFDKKTVVDTVARRSHDPAHVPAFVERPADVDFEVAPACPFDRVQTGACMCPQGGLHGRLHLLTEHLHLLVVAVLGFVHFRWDAPN